MEDASAVDLDWFWRGWFYGTDAVDISLDSVKAYTINTKNPETNAAYDRQQYERNNLQHISAQRNRDEGTKFAVEADTSLKDFYGKFDRFSATPVTKESYQAMYNSLSPEEKQFYESKNYFYQLNLSNKGGLVMPLIVEWTYTDGTKEVDRISAYIWRKNEQKISKVFAKTKEVKSIKIDPYRETADIDEENNSWPRSFTPSRFELFKQQTLPRGVTSGGNLMQQQSTTKKTP